MKKNRSNIILLILSCLFILGCEDEKNIDPVPFISLVNVSATDVKQFTDSIIITIKYEDEDGDLGYSDPDSNSLWVKDERLTNPDHYYIPLLAPEDASVHILGNINIRLRNTFLIGSGGEEFTRFRIRLKDRAGNWSNEVVTPQITIKE